MQEPEYVASLLYTHPPMDAKDEIKMRLPIDQLVAQYCQLKRKGKSFVALCPFHNDSKPSLLVSPDKGIAYCFACQSGGDIFSFVQKIEGIDFPAALKMLAEKAGVELPKLGAQNFKPSVTKDEKERLRECLQTAQKFYMTKLAATPIAKSYVEKRGVTEELIGIFGIGYAPDSFSETYDHLLKAGFQRSEIVAAGLGVQKEITEERIYDRFRHRIMFPISDAQGGIIGFGGRTMGDSDAKYVNSPESILYNKSAVLYGLFQARDAIRASHRVVLVEGYFDCVAAHKAGIKNVVAVSGTALTEEHVKILKRYADEVVLCLDQDNAGQLAAARAFDMLSKAQLKILSVTLPAKDPDELIQRDSALFTSIITESAVPYVDAVINHLKKAPDRSEPSGKRRIAEVLFPLLAALPTSVELRAYLGKAASDFGIIEREMADDFATFRTAAAVPGRKEKKVMSFTEAPFHQAELCLGIGFMYPLARPLLKEMIPLDNPDLEVVRLALSDASPELDTIGVLRDITVDASIKERMQVLALYCEENFPLWSESLAQKEMKKFCAAANRAIVVERQMKLIVQLKEARANGRSDDEARLLTQYQQLLKLGMMTNAA